LKTTCFEQQPSVRSRRRIEFARLAVVGADATVTQLRMLMEQADSSGLKYQSAECSLYLGAALIGVKDSRQAKA
jgi:hypothetical protein